MVSKEILYLAEQLNCKILLPKDIVIAKDLKPNSNEITVNFNECPSDFMILDAGINSTEIFQNEISTVFSCLNIGNQYTYIHTYTVVSLHFIT